MEVVRGTVIGGDNKHTFSLRDPNGDEHKRFRAETTSEANAIAREYMDELKRDLGPEWARLGWHNEWEVVGWVGL